MTDDKKSDTDFGYQRVSFAEKTRRVGAVFHSVAKKYDVMNDVMSFGVHRLWKRMAVEQLTIRPGMQILDLAAGTGDMAMRILPLVGSEGCVTLADMSGSMLQEGRKRLDNAGMVANVHYAITSAEWLPFPDNHFDRIIIAFGLRNVTYKDKALAAMYRVLKPGGMAIVLEFSTPVMSGIKPFYDAYSFKILPVFGKFITDDSESYRYLAESISMHPDQETLLTMMQAAGFDRCDYQNMTGGIVALHKGFKY